MRLITWNCQGAFRKKVHNIVNLLPDILIIQECECPEKLIFEVETIKPNQALWYGDNVHKGIGIFSYSDYKFTLLDSYNPAIKYVIPILISKDGSEFLLFAIWANNKHDPDGQYVTQVWKAIHYYDADIRNYVVILAGDFNSNKIWDKKTKIGTHSHVVNHLANRNIHSVYHHHFGEEQGKESQPTFYLYRNQEKSYHMDYCFVSEPLLKKLSSFSVGDFGEWISYSDHMPVMVEIVE